MCAASEPLVAAPALAHCGGARVLTLEPPLPSSLVIALLPVNITFVGPFALLLYVVLGAVVWLVASRCSRRLRSARSSRKQQVCSGQQRAGGWQARGW